MIFYTQAVILVLIQLTVNINSHKKIVLFYKNISDNYACFSFSSLKFFLLLLQINNQTILKFYSLSISLCSLFDVLLTK